MRRREFGKLALLALAGVPILAACTSGSKDVPAVPKWRGADISFTLQEEAIGTRLTARAGGTVQGIERILAQHGANAARLRVWVDPPAGYSNEESLLTLARRAHAAGMEILLDLHYSDFWADQSTQTTPVSWQGQSLSQLEETVRSYTRQVVSALNAQGTPPSVVQIGNEVTNGMLWPSGRVDFGSGGEDWSGFATLLKAGVQGVHDAPGPYGPASTMIHIQGIENREATRYTLDHIFGAGVEMDLIGLSYYPFWHGPLATLQTALHDLAGRFGKDLVVAETSYPWTLEVAGESDLYVSSSSTLPESAKYPATPAGQAGYFEALKDVLANVPGGHGAGFFAWEPGWLTGVAAYQGTGDPYANLTMFDHAGVALPALGAFADNMA